jgi:2-acylglycerol O-acyltransferase 2
LLVSPSAHPHPTHRLAFWGGAFHRLFPGLRIPVLLAASVLFSIPGSRELCDWLGAVNARKSSAVNALRQGANVAVYPGGTAEILTTVATSPKTTLLCRTGFLRLALVHGVPVVPVFCFNEKKLYNRVKLPRFLSTLIYRVLKLPLLLFGGWCWSWLPNRKPLTVVFGKPIEVVKNEHPTEEDVHALLKEYMQQQVDIYNTFKGNLGYPASEYLEIVEAKEKTQRV